MEEAAEETGLNTGTQTRDRIVLAAGLGLVCLLAWGITIMGAKGMAAMPSHAWSAGQFVAVFLMWVIMMGAMMLPAVAPMVDSFMTINRRRRERDAPYVATMYFVGGYLVAWAGYSAVATSAHWALERAGLLDTMMQSSSLWLSGALFLAAGLYQWTPLKEVCLTRCRSPVGFILSEWRDGALGAIVMGLRHGGYCIGCCAALMALLFAVAVMSLPWVAALTVLVMIEKLLPGGAFWRHAIGVGLTVTGIVLVGRALFI
jgi:predicted metal-binding membrane protein